MELPPELTRLPPQSLDVFRYMGQTGVTQGDTDSLAAGTGMSDRGIKRAIRGLVTAGYLNMDDTYVYYLTEKGAKAVEDITEYDASQPDHAIAPDAAFVQHNLVVVMASPLGAQETSTLQLGVYDAPSVNVPSQLVLRLSATSGNISPNEITLEVNPDEEVEPGEAYYTPTGQHGKIRIRVEAMQIVNVTDIHAAGGMFVEVDIASQSGLPKAWHSQIELQSS
jgi:predicted transcriptional regulator